MDGAINPEDAVDADHYAALVEYCDFNNDGTLDSCEIHDCIVICENEWRDEYCPDYGYVYCSCPFSTPVCEGAWNCADIVYITEELMAYYDTNNDGNINLGDDIDSEHLAALNEYCDLDDNDSLNVCEVHECIVKVENEWRAEYCPESESVYCNSPYVCATCDGAWDCEDIYNIASESMAYWDTNGDG